MFEREIEVIKSVFWRKYTEYNSKIEEKAVFLAALIEQNESQIVEMIGKIEKTHQLLKEFVKKSEKIERLKGMHQAFEEKEKVLQSEILALKIEKKANLTSQKAFLKRISGFQQSLERTLQANFSHKM